MSHVWMRAPGNEGVTAGARIVAKGALEGSSNTARLNPATASEHLR